MSEPIRPFEPLTSENAAALDLIDHHVGLMTGSRLFNGELKHNAVALTPPFRGLPSRGCNDRILTSATYTVAIGNGRFTWAPAVRGPGMCR